MSQHQSRTDALRAEFLPAPVRVPPHSASAILARRMRLNGHPNAHQSSELDIVSESEMRRRRIAEAIRLDAERVAKKKWANEMQRAAIILRAAARSTVNLPLYGPPTKAMTIARIKYAVAHEFEVTVKQMCGPRRYPHLAIPRMVAMHLVRKITKHSLNGVGKSFDRAHTSVLHAGRKIGQMIESDPSFAERVARIEAELTGRVDSIHAEIKRRGGE